MQNFKQYLKEDNSENFAHLDLFISFTADLQNDYEYEDLFNAIKSLKIPGLEIVGYARDSINIEIRFDINWLKTNQQTLQEYQIKIYDTISPLIKPIKLDLTFSTSDINLRTIPDFIVNWNSIVINAQPNSSLKNIHKFIKCDYLAINDIHNVKSNVLGLLLFDKHVEIEIFGISQAKWGSIIKKYFIGNRDILECQEELIANGLGDYAKL